MLAPLVVCLTAGLVYTWLPLGPDGERPLAPGWLILATIIATLLLPVGLVGSISGSIAVSRVPDVGRSLFVGWALCLALLPTWLAMLAFNGGEVICSVVPCNFSREFTVVNWQSRELWVSFDGLDPGAWMVAPCAVREIRLSQPPRRRVIQFQVRDAAGNVVFTARFGLSGADRQTADDTFEVPERSTRECPELKYIPYSPY
jgi:hypothetical protein